MSTIIRKICISHVDIGVFNVYRAIGFPRKSHSSYDKERVKKDDEEEFRVLQILPQKRENIKPRDRFQEKAMPPRTTRMAFDQDWPSVWPGPRTFHPATVPLPVRQGFREKGAPPGKFANAELMKIPNFLHLTPPAIQRHCEALKKWCTPWPEELNNEEEMDRHFPVNVIASDYCHASPTIRDPKSRVVSLKIKLSSLELDHHARDKFLRLVGERYNPETDILTITTDNCPLKKQNYDHAQYILAALYHEAWCTEDWEKDKVDADQELYIFANRPAKKSVEDTFAYNNRTVPDLTEVGESIERLFNEGETEESIERYKQAVLNIIK